MNSRVLRGNEGVVARKSKILADVHQTQVCHEFRRLRSSNVVDLEGRTPGCKYVLPAGCDFC